MTQQGEVTHPYIYLLIILVLTPSLRPLWCGRVSPFHPGRSGLVTVW
jgi:hypothetical protein